jgi:ATP-GRASP peptide maturase of grasp-with-spasm system
MILIKSQPNDLSTDHVMEWIDYFGFKSVRIDVGNKIEKVLLAFDADSKVDPVFTLQFENGCVINSGEVTSFWARRGTFELKYPKGLVSDLDQIRTIFDHLPLSGWIKYEWKELEAFIVHHFVTKKKCLSNPETYSINKLYQLSVAGELGLKIPQTLVTTEKKELEKAKFSKITKALWEGFSFTIEDEGYYAFTNKVDEDSVEVLSDQFFPSYFQKELEKAFELRIFYLEGICYSMAIFSQMDEQTASDFRHYNWEKPNRTVPFILPKNIEQKLIRFMEIVKLVTGSIDMVVTKGGDYVFLEVNPVGQFGMVSYPCNYGLEKKIAEFLIRDK